MTTGLLTGHRLAQPHHGALNHMEQQQLNSVRIAPFEHPLAVAP
jgi:hypothetical protein